jgi:hypothetical protein
MTDRVATLIRGRRDRLARLLGHPLRTPHQDESPLTSDSRQHLFEEAEDLYWNELEWEHLTEEEATEGSPPLSELTFPGLLAFVRGLLLTHVNPDALAPAEPRPQVVDDVLGFLARRVLGLEEKLAGEVDDEARLRGELVMTDRLLDLVLYRYHGLTDDEVERVETVRAH